MTAGSSRVLLVNSDRGVVRAVSAALRGERYAVVPATGRRGALAAASSQPIGIAIISTRLHDGQAIELGRILRTRNDLGLLFTSREPGLLLDAYEAGADDFVGEPIDLVELLVRVRALARRLDLSAHVSYDFGPLQLCPAQHLARANGYMVDLTPTEFKLLELFMCHPNTVLTRRRILNKVWANEVVSRNTVERHLSTLRSKLHACGVDKVIRTVYGVGYKMTLQH